jgi:hypothetical protein
MSVVSITMGRNWAILACLRGNLMLCRSLCSDTACWKAFGSGSPILGVE